MRNACNNLIVFRAEPVPIAALSKRVLTYKRIVPVRGLAAYKRAYFIVVNRPRSFPNRLGGPEAPSFASMASCDIDPNYRKVR